jgi:hypothetical protein
MLVDILCQQSSQGIIALMNLDTGSLSCVGVAGCDASGIRINFAFGRDFMNSTADGTKVFLSGDYQSGSGVLDFVANTLTINSTSNGSADAAANADFNRFAMGYSLLDSSLNQTTVAQDFEQLSVGTFSPQGPVGEKFNPSGSLLFVPTQPTSRSDEYVDVIDVHRGRLARRIALPEGLPQVLNGMAIDETGLKLFLISNTGITIVQLSEAPLSIGSVSPAAGVGGTQLTIRGSGFKSGTVAQFETLPVPTTFVDDETLQISVPSSLPPGAHRIVVINPNGQGYLYDDAFTVE